MKKKIFFTAILFCTLHCPHPLVFSRDSWAQERGAIAAGRTYTIGIIPFYSPEKIWSLYTPFVNHLNKTTRVRWELKLYHNHEAIVQDICDGSLTIALFGPAPLGRANKKCGVEPLLVSLGSDGTPYYHSVIITGDPAITSLAQLKGKPFGFLKGSTAAHIVPAEMLREAGLTLDMIKPVFYESQDSIMSALLRNEIAAAGVKESLFRKFKGSILKPIAVSGPLPHFSFCAAPTLPAGVKQQFVTGLAALKPRENQRDRMLMAGWDDEIKNGFVLPPETFLTDVLRLSSATEETLHETR